MRLKKELPTQPKTAILVILTTRVKQKNDLDTGTKKLATTEHRDLSERYDVGE